MIRWKTVGFTQEIILVQLNISTIQLSIAMDNEKAKQSGNNSKEHLSLLLVSQQNKEVPLIVLDTNMEGDWNRQ